MLYDLLVTTYLEELHYLPKYCDGGWGGVAEKFIQGNPDEFFGQPNITQLIINRRWGDLSY